LGHLFVSHFKDLLPNITSLQRKIIKVPMDLSKGLFPLPGTCQNLGMRYTSAILDLPRRISMATAAIMITPTETVCQ
jgi:hypothetical protein